MSSKTSEMYEATHKRNHQEQAEDELPCNDENGYCGYCADCNRHYGGED